MGGGASVASPRAEAAPGAASSVVRRSSLGILTPEEKVKQKEEKAKQEEVKKSSQHYVIDHLYYSIPVRSRSTFVERARGINGVIRPPPSVFEREVDTDLIPSTEVIKIPVLWIEVDGAKLKTLYSETAADRLMGFYCRGVGIDDRGHLYVLPRHRQDSMLFIHGDLLRRCQSVPAAPEPPVVISSTKNSLLISWGLPQTEDHPLGIVDKFEVQYQRETTSYTWIALAQRDVFTGMDNLTQHDYTGLQPDRGFRFRVRCRNRWGWGPFSKASQVYCTLPERPARPSRPFPSLLTSTTVMLHWRGEEPSEDGGTARHLTAGLRTRYTLRMRNKQGNIVNHQTGTLNSYVLDELTPGATYTFEVEAANQSGASGFSHPTILRLPMRDPLLPSAEQLSSFYTLPSNPRHSDGTSGQADGEDRSSGTNALAEFEYLLRAGENWHELWEPDGERVFYFNVITGERQPHPPPEFLAYHERQQERQRLQAAQNGQEATADPASTGSANHAASSGPDDGEGGDEKEGSTAEFRKKRARFWRCLHKSAGATQSPKNMLLQISVKRSSVLVDSFMAFMNVQTKDLRKRTKVHFQDEEGIDSGGLTKDWYMAVSRAFRTPSHHRFFRTTGGGQLEVEYEEVEQGGENRLQYFRFMGKFMAKALYDRMNVDLPLCHTLYKQILGLPITMADVEELDGALFRSLQWMSGNDIEGILFEKFSVIVKRKDGKEEELELCEGGKNKDVKDDNKKEYIELMSQWRAKFAVAQEVEALLEGMELVLSEPSLKDFTVSELDLLLNGLREIDVDQVRAYCTYHGGFHDKHIVVLWLWQALREFTNEQRARFLKFVTSSDRIPLDGFTPAFNVTEGVDMDRDKDLPRSHTCFNQLVLPRYRSYGVLYEKVLYAIENSEGFAMT